MVTPTTEDYLKTIYRLQAGESRVAPSDVATAMGVKPPTVTKTLQRMHDDGLVDHESYRGAVLTESGERRALELLRHHRLLELFLTERLGYDWSEVHEEAEVLEHYVSETLEARIAERLGFPTVDPHGAPIPTVDLELLRDESRWTLDECREGDVAVVAEVRDDDPELLGYLAAAGVELGTVFEVTEVAPVGLITLEPRGTDDPLSLPVDAASNVSLARPDGASVSDDGRYDEEK